MEQLFNFLFPKRCVGCGKLNTYFCQECIQNIAQSDLVCPHCERASVGGMTHPICRRRFALDGLWSLGIYQGSLQRAIKKLKYSWVTEIAEPLVNLTIEYWAKHSPYFLDEIKKSGGENWVIIPVPLHKSRQNWRGFNQATLLGKLIAQKLGLSYSEALIRTKNTKPQVGKDSYKRKQNIKNAFKLIENCELKIENCILLDDIWTTGSTLRECSYVLKRSGAKKVWAITLAR